MDDFATLSRNVYYRPLEASDAVIGHTCIKMFKEKRKMTTTKADSAFVSYSCDSVSEVELNIQVTKCLCDHCGGHCGWVLKSLIE